MDAPRWGAEGLQSCCRAGPSVWEQCRLVWSEAGSAPWTAQVVRDDECGDESGCEGLSLTAALERLRRWASLDLRGCLTHLRRLARRLGLAGRLPARFAAVPAAAVATAIAIAFMMLRDRGSGGKRACGE